VQWPVALRVIQLHYQALAGRELVEKEADAGVVAAEAGAVDGREPVEVGDELRVVAVDEHVD